MNFHLQGCGEDSDLGGQRRPHLLDPFIEAREKTNQPCPSLALSRCHPLFDAARTLPGFPSPFLTTFEYEEIQVGFWKSNKWRV
ncbi:hypothetical protein K443DRAFT_445605 [Laccaria amethystina LaAM-08-1]|uniref:Uncharacterized protein n=1 Tax=Laccaria amethystina LaAM-08-1 TaxID=1095629 RepID=A0A0C9X6W1_9AGAR|nr:hypothetical protein K443DRAFT_445605 [Laccaria amethystina LaAM-08-1]